MDDRVWTQVSVRVPPNMEDPMCDFLTTLTRRGVSIREGGGQIFIDSFLEPGGMEESLLFLEKYIGDLVEMDLLPAGTRFQLEELPEEDWMAVFRSQHTTIRVSDSLVVRPTWCDPTGAREIILDPGLAFGTGSHPTTRMCLVLLDGWVGAHHPSRMFDLGTGSGILAIAGAYLGIPDILASDIDTVATEVTLLNARINEVEDRIAIAVGGVETARGTYDLITANLSASLLRKLASAIADHLEPGGALIISGILEEEKEGVVEAFTRCGLAVGEEMVEKVWVAALLRREV